MSKTVDVITPADYHPVEGETFLAVNRQLKENLHSQFVTSLRKYSEESGWVMHMLPEGAPDAGFPEVCVIPDGQGKVNILHSFRIDAGIPDILQPEDATRDDVDRIIRIALLTQRKVAGPLDIHLPGVLSSRPIATFTSHGEGSYNPDQWAKAGFEFVKELWLRREDIELFREMFS